MKDNCIAEYIARQHQRPRSAHEPARRSEIELRAQLQGRSALTRVQEAHRQGRRLERLQA
jgi:hypothetical protein